jgi:protocatechuate 3,4-dioxygenase beta subunit
MTDYEHPHESTPRRMTRRGSLATAGGLLAAAVAGWKVDASEGASSAGAGPAGVASGAVSCVLTPELTEGPYYIADEKVRRNITEGKPGTPLTLRIAVVDASSCKAVKGAAVDIWHCDAGGVYSGFSSAGGRGGGRQQPTDKLSFLRGIQRTSADGVATFETIYPGWYSGRAVHIHLKVHIGGNVVHTGQLFFPETLTDAVYERSPYNRRPNRDVRNPDDSIFRNGGDKGLLGLKKSGNGYVGTITTGVHTS